MSQPLNDFISQIRQADTIENEKFIIATELAKVRAEFKKRDVNTYPKYLAKLIFLECLGNSVAWGQIEATTLIGSKRIEAKQWGYLAVSLLYQESSDISVLLTQSVLSDLANPDTYIQELALTFIANSGLEDLCREVFVTVQKLLKTATNKNVLKKCGMAACRIIKICPDLADTFKNSVQPLLNNSNHSVILAGIYIVLESIKADPNLIKKWKNFSKPFIQILKSLRSHARPPRYDYSGVYDPFLQVSILRVLTILKADDEELDDLLQNIIVTLDARKNSARAVLYQTMETICALAKQDSVRASALNMVGRLLTCKDTNILFSSLMSLRRVLYQNQNCFTRGSADSVALGRYRNRLISLLANHDGSIRRAAISLIVAMLDRNNVKTAVPEIMQYLKTAEGDFRAELVNRLYYNTVQLSDDPMWTLETCFEILRQSGDYFLPDLMTSFTELILASPALHKRAVELSVGELNAAPNQAAIQASSFFVGELNVTDPEVLKIMETLMSLPQTTDETRLFLLTAHAKTAVRMGLAEQSSNVMGQYAVSNALEVQQRAGELQRMLMMGDVGAILLAPIIDEEQTHHPSAAVSLLDLSPENSQKVTTADNNPQKTQKSTNADDLLLELLGTPSPQNAQEDFPAAINGQRKLLELPRCVIYGETRKNPKDPKQLAVCLVAYPRLPLSEFGLEVQPGPGWRASIQPAPRREVTRTSPFQQVAYLLDAAGQPLVLNIAASYRLDGQPSREVGAIRNLE